MHGAPTADESVAVGSDPSQQHETPWASPWIKAEAQEERGGGGEGRRSNMKPPELTGPLREDRPSSRPACKIVRVLRSRGRRFGVFGGRSLPNPLGDRPCPAGLSGESGS